MPITANGLANLASSVDLHIEEVGPPPTGGLEPHVLRVVPSSLAVTNLGALVGTLSDLVPVTLEVDWVVTDEADKTLNAGPTTFMRIPPKERLPQITLVFAPPIVEALAGAPPLFVTRYVSAKVTLSASGVKSPEVTLLRQKLRVPALPVPTLAAFFAKPDFGKPPGDQAALIVVPRGSPITGIAPLRDALERLKTGTDLVSSLASAAGTTLTLAGMATGINSLSTALRAHVSADNVGIAFAAGDQIRNLNNIDVVTHGWFSNDIEAEDILSSMILFGRPGRRIRCYQHRGFTGAAFTLRSGDACFGLIKNFDTTSLATEPAGLLENVKTNFNYNNRLSSLSFL